MSVNIESMNSKFDTLLTLVQHLNESDFSFKAICIQESWLKENQGTALLQIPGPRLNIKTVLSTYGDFHVKDKTAVRTSYL